MNISEFKVNDIITRSKPIIYPTGVKDSSYCGTRIIVLGLDPKSKIIFFKEEDSYYKNEIRKLTYARDRWDEDWEYFPESLFQKIKKALNILKK